MIALAVKIFPERLVRERPRRFHIGRNCGSGDGAKHLRRQRGRAVEMIEPNRNRQTIILAQRWKKAGLKKRGLAETGDAVKQSEIIAPDQSDEVLDLVTATGEKLTIAFGKRSQPDPRMLRIGHFRPGFAHWEAAFRRRSRTMSVRLLTKSAWGSPPAARV